DVVAITVDDIRVVFFDEIENRQLARVSSRRAFSLDVAANRIDGLPARVFSDGPFHLAEHHRRRVRHFRCNGCLRLFCDGIRPVIGPSRWGRLHLPCALLCFLCNGLGLLATLSRRSTLRNRCRCRLRLFCGGVRLVTGLGRWGSLRLGCSAFLWSLRNRLSLLALLRRGRCPRRLRLFCGGIGL